MDVVQVECPANSESQKGSKECTCVQGAVLFRGECTLIESLWTDCATENQECTCSYKARIGEGQNWAVLDIPTGTTVVPCTTGAFGSDPSPDAAKTCQCLPRV